MAFINWLGHLHGNRQRFLRKGCPLYQVPLKFVKIGPDTCICATRIVAISSTKSFQARQSLKVERRNKTLLNGCGKEAAATVIYLDNGTVVSSPYSIGKLQNAIDRATAKEMHTKRIYTNSKTMKEAAEEAEMEEGYYDEEDALELLQGEDPDGDDIL